MNNEHDFLTLWCVESGCTSVPVSCVFLLFINFAVLTPHRLDWGTPWVSGRPYRRGGEELYHLPPDPTAERARLRGPPPEKGETRGSSSPLLGVAIVAEVHRSTECTTESSTVLLLLPSDVTRAVFRGPYYRAVALSPVIRADSIKGTADGCSASSSWVSWQLRRIVAYSKIRAAESNLNR